MALTEWPGTNTALHLGVPGQQWGDVNSRSNVSPRLYGSTAECVCEPLSKECEQPRRRLGAQISLLLRHPPVPFIDVKSTIWDDGVSEGLMHDTYSDAAMTRRVEMGKEGITYGEGHYHTKINSITGECNRVDVGSDILQVCGPLIRTRRGLGYIGEDRDRHDILWQGDTMDVCLSQQQDKAFLCDREGFVSLWDLNTQQRTWNSQTTPYLTPDRFGRVASGATFAHISRRVVRMYDERAPDCIGTVDVGLKAASALDMQAVDNDTLFVLTSDEIHRVDWRMNKSISSWLHTQIPWDESMRIAAAKGKKDYVVAISGACVGTEVIFRFGNANLEFQKTELELPISTCDPHIARSSMTLMPQTQLLVPATDDEEAFDMWSLQYKGGLWKHRLSPADQGPVVPSKSELWERPQVTFGKRHLDGDLRMNVGIPFIYREDNMSEWIYTHQRPPLQEPVAYTDDDADEDNDNAGEFPLVCDQGYLPLLGYSSLEHMREQCYKMWVDPLRLDSLEPEIAERIKKRRQESIETIVNGMKQLANPPNLSLKHSPLTPFAAKLASCWGTSAVNIADFDLMKQYDDTRRVTNENFVFMLPSWAKTPLSSQFLEQGLHLPEVASERRAQQGRTGRFHITSSQPASMIRSSRATAMRQPSDTYEMSFSQGLPQPALQLSQVMAHLDPTSSSQEPASTTTSNPKSTFISSSQPAPAKRKLKPGLMSRPPAPKAKKKKKRVEGFG